MTTAAYCDVNQPRHRAPILPPRSPAIHLVGRSAAIATLQQDVDRLAGSAAKVLITGETGVGKEVVARSIHARSTRAANVFAPVNCAGLPETLLESELFGHTRGSFTGAYRDKTGKLEAAQRGTVFLDEVGEMTLRMQGLLLRFLETGEIQRVGADGAGRHVDVRVIAATNRDLQDMTRHGTFREDLFYRLNVIHIIVPPLRDRREDIPLLISHFLAAFSSPDSGALPQVSQEAMKKLTAYAWPGNVRELQNVVERILATGAGPMIDVEHLPPELLGEDRPQLRPERERRRTVVDDLYWRMRDGQESFWVAVYPLFKERELTRANLRDIVRRGLEEAGGNYKVVARLFNMDSTEYKRFLSFLRKHNCQIPFHDYR